VPDFALATIADARGTTAALVLDGHVHPLAGRPSVRALLEDWDVALAELDALVTRGDLAPAVAVTEARLRPPVPDPPNLYMAGANYADHAREMRKLPPDAPIEKSPQGPFIFLKPTTTLVGHGDEVVLGPGCERVDWEVELAAVIGRRAHMVAVADALDHVAGYTVANDVSVRDHFIREPSEPPMKFHWFGQKGWATSCPLGPWLVPARDLPQAGDAVLRLTRNGVVEQESRTSQMLFSTAEQIAFLSGIVPLVPGDVICTGTPAGVGAGQGRFLAPGDVMVAEVEGIGRLENPVVAAVRTS
jgi:2-keto-4-pentenoate hydratase/2-oxohepta-3-ene-1,7-dioic acid hydratase in catechol pathway